MRVAGCGIHGDRIRALVVILWRAGLRINEALTLAETDLEPRRGSILVRQGKGGKRREVGMDEWAWEHVERWSRHRIALPIGPFLCVVDGATSGRPWSQTGARAELRRLSVMAGVRRRFAPHQLRHAHAIEMAREGVPPTGHPTPARPRAPRRDQHYLQGIDTTEIIDTIHGRRPPMMPASAGLAL
ncbi:MAG: tyrosine-type recombinase/integrase [Solirubrobacteraceae bacterium]